MRIVFLTALLVVGLAGAFAPAPSVVAANAGGDNACDGGSHHSLCQGYPGASTSLFRQGSPLGGVGQQAGS